MVQKLDPDFDRFQPWLLTWLTLREHNFLSIDGIWTKPVPINMTQQGLSIGTDLVKIQKPGFCMEAIANMKVRGTWEDHKIRYHSYRKMPQIELSTNRQNLNIPESTKHDNRKGNWNSRKKSNRNHRSTNIPSLPLFHPSPPTSYNYENLNQRPFS